MQYNITNLMTNARTKRGAGAERGAWSVPFLTQLRRRGFWFFWHYRTATRNASTLSQRISHAPLNDPWQGDATQGQPLANGRAPQDIFGAGWHDFAWLRDMREYGGQNARTNARRYLLEWLEQHSQWDAAVWQPMLLAHRMKTLMLTWGWFGQSAQESQQIKFLASLMVQSACLAQDLTRLRLADQRIEAISALLLDHAFRQSDSHIESLIRDVLSALDSAVFADGCHASRRVDRHIICLKTLHEIKYALGMVQQRRTKDDSTITEALTTIDALINRMGGVARMWCLNKREFIAMSHGLDAALPDIEQILNMSGPRGKICQHAQEGGFIRLASARNVAIFNTGPQKQHLPRIKKAGGEADAAVGGIEFSSQGQRILISGGNSHALTASYPELAELMNGTAAHSALSIDQINVSQINAGQINARRINAGRINQDITDARQACAIYAEVGAARGGILGVATHDGYRQLFGIFHERKIFLSTDGQTLKGQDILRYNGEPTNIPTEAVIRFHLHPRITASQTNNKTILLKLPARMVSWKFICSNGKIVLEDSITALNGKPQKCQQIVIRLPLTTIRHETEIAAAWALMKLTKPK